MNLRWILSLALFSFILKPVLAQAGSPNNMTFQTKIVLPNGSALEANNVNFRFTILDAAGTCVLYVEDFNSINMSGTKGVVSFPLGSGTKQYPPTATILTDVFNNSAASFSCQAGGTFSPTSSANRQVVMQFNDGSGWQTLPQMAINAVPFANYASRSESLGDFAANSYLRPTTLPTCTGSQALTWNGTTFTCITAGGGGGGAMSGVTSIANASGDITLAPVTTTGKVIITSNTPSTGSSTGALVVQGGVGVTGAINSAGAITSASNITSSSTVSAATSMYTPQLYGTSTPSGVIKIDGTSNATAGTVQVATVGNGKLVVGTTTPQSITNATATFYSKRSNMGIGNTTLYSVLDPSPSASDNKPHMSIAGEAQYNSTYNITAGGHLSAVYGTLYSNGPGTIYDANGIFAEVFGPGANVTNLSGVKGYISGTGGNATNAYGGQFIVANSSSNYTNAYGVSASVTNLGSVGTAYGVYVGSVQGTNKYSIYASDANAPSYFAGKISVGTTTSTYAVNVSGDVNVSGNFRVNGSVFSGGGGGGAMTGVTSISNASGDITLAPAVATGAVQINSGAASLGTTTGALVVQGGVGVSGAINAGGAINTTSTLTTGGAVGIGTTTPTGDLYIYNPSGSADTTLTVDSPNSGSRIDMTSFPGGGIHKWSIRNFTNGVGSNFFQIMDSWNANYPFQIEYGAGDKSLYLRQGGNVGIGTSTPSEKLQVQGNIRSTGQIYSDAVITSAGSPTATVDFDTGNTQVLQNVGQSAITLNNMKDGASYILIITDTTARTYTFTNCTVSKFSPINAQTTSLTTTVYNILKVTIGGTVNCFISWSSGYQ